MHFALSNGEQKWCTVGGVGTMHSVKFLQKFAQYLNYALVVNTLKKVEIS